MLLAVNKLDDLERSTAQYDFYQLGFGDPIGVSAAVGKGSGDLLDAVVAELPPRGAVRTPTRSAWRWWAGPTSASHRW